MTIIFSIWKTAGILHHCFELQFDWQLATICFNCSVECVCISGGYGDNGFQDWKAKEQAVGFLVNILVLSLLIFAYLGGTLCHLLRVFFLWS